MAAVFKCTTCEWLQCVNVLFGNGFSDKMYYLGMAVVVKCTIWERLQCLNVLFVNGCSV